MADVGREVLAVFIAVMRGYGFDETATTHAIRRMREEGHIFLGEAFVVPREGTKELVEKLKTAYESEG